MTAYKDGKVYTGGIVDTEIVNRVSMLPRIVLLNGYYKDITSDTIVLFTNKEACIADVTAKLYIVTGYCQEYGTNHIMIEHSLYQEVTE